ncbi:hypothetical protein D3C76_1588000 [compost metagenome]
MIMLVPWLDSQAIRTSENIAVALEPSQFWFVMPNSPSSWFKIPLVIGSNIHSHTTDNATPEATAGK